jgi:hypothetical protein
MITLKGGATSAAMGLIDIGANYSDQKAGRVEMFKRATDWVRVGGVVGGLMIDRYGYRMGRAAAIGAPLFYSSLPLLIRTVGNAVAPAYVPSLMGKSARRPALGAGVRAMAPAARVKVPLAPNGARSL